MKEDLLSFIWFQKLFNTQQLSTSGKAVEIVDVGLLNSDSGPDVFNAKIKIDNKLWIGNVEFHVKSSDWLRHHHIDNPMYQSVILHVVLEADMDIFRSNGEYIEQLVLSFPDKYLDNYNTLFNSKEPLKCGRVISNVDSLVWSSFVDRLAVERVENKALYIENRLKIHNGDWEASMYELLFRSFGLSVNSDAFERLAFSLPYSLLRKYSSNIYQIEALLLGQAGLLDKTIINDAYYTKLATEYKFLSVKHKLKPLGNLNFKFSRTRPHNFPTVKIAQLSKLLESNWGFFSKILQNRSYSSLVSLFEVEPTEYWKTHFQFGEESSVRTKKLSLNTINILIINTVIPIWYAYAKYTANDELVEDSINLLQSIEGEKNFITQLFSNYGFKSESALQSQAMIQLKREYCDKNNCLRCPVSKEFLCH